MATCVRTEERSNAIARGALRDPGATTASRTPAATSASTSARAQRTFAAPVSATAALASAPGGAAAARSGSEVFEGIAHGRELALGLLPFQRRIGSRHDPGPGGQERPTAGDEGAAKPDGEIAVTARRHPPDRPGVPAAIARLPRGDPFECRGSRAPRHRGGRVEARGQAEDVGSFRRLSGDARAEVE